MTLQELLIYISSKALKHKLVNSAMCAGSLYKINENTIKDYPLLFVQPSSDTRVEENTITYNIVLYYIDRLQSDDSNDLAIYSTATQVLTDFVRMLRNDENVIDLDTARITLFTETEKLADRCSGAYVRLAISVLGDSTCSTIEDFDITKVMYVTENGEYNVFGYDKVSVLVKTDIPFNTIRKQGDWLYYTEYDELDYDYAKEHFEKQAPALSGGCSCKVQNGFAGRNYDWYYNNQETFVVKTPNTIGVAGMESLTRELLESKENVNDFKVLPFYLQDGENADGLFAEINVVNATGFRKTIPLIEKRESICTRMLVRYILDNFSSVNEAVEYLQNYVEIYNPQVYLDKGYEAHYLLADSEKSVVIEFIENGIVAIPSDKSTNFHLYGVEFNEDGSVNTPQTAIDGHYASENHINEYEVGLERYNALNSGNITDVESAMSVMRGINFSKAYTNEIGEGFWYSEFVGGDITNDTPANDENVIARAQEYKEAFEHATREQGIFWITTHTSVYDLANTTLYINVQEEQQQYIFPLYDVLQLQVINDTIEENGEYHYYPSEEYDGIGEVNIMANFDTYKKAEIDSKLQDERNYTISAISALESVYVASTAAREIWVGTESEYEAISHLNNVIYMVKADEGE